MYDTRFEFRLSEPQRRELDALASELVCRRPLWRGSAFTCFCKIGMRCCSLQTGKPAYAGPDSDKGALLLRQRRIHLQDERINVSAKLGHNERHLVDHKAGDEIMSSSGWPPSALGIALATVLGVLEHWGNQLPLGRGLGLHTTLHSPFSV